MQSRFPRFLPMCPGRGSIGGCFPPLSLMRAATKAKRPAAKRTVKKVTAKKKTATKRTPKIQILGRVVHYYDKISVAIVELARPLKVGDAVTFKRGEQEHTQMVGSLQIEHVQITKAKKGDVVGLKVTQEVVDGSLVTPA